METVILDFVKASKGHTGAYLAARISECLNEFGIASKILALVADNASNNNTLVSELEYLLPSYRGSVTRVRCFAHILNLVVKAILSQFSHSKGKAKIQPSVADAENEEEPDLELDLEDSDDEGDNISEPEDPADEIEPAVEDNDNLLQHKRSNLATIQLQRCEI